MQNTERRLPSTTGVTDRVETADLYSPEKQTPNNHTEHPQMGTGAEGASCRKDLTSLGKNIERAPPAQTPTIAVDVPKPTPNAQNSPENTEKNDADQNAQTPCDTNLNQIAEQNNQPKHDTQKDTNKTHNKQGGDLPVKTSVLEQDMASPGTQHDGVMEEKGKSEALFGPSKVSESTVMVNEGLNKLDRKAPPIPETLRHLPIDHPDVVLREPARFGTVMFSREEDMIHMHLI